MDNDNSLRVLRELAALHGEVEIAVESRKVLRDGRKPRKQSIQRVEVVITLLRSVLPEVVLWASGHMRRSEVSVLQVGARMSGPLEQESMKATFIYARGESPGAQVVNRPVSRVVAETMKHTLKQMNPSFSDVEKNIIFG